MKLIYCAPLLGMLIALRVHADAGSEMLDAPKDTSTATRLCYRAYCADLGRALDDKHASRALEKRAEAKWKRSSEVEWQQNLIAREQREEHNCLLSVGFGGSLSVHGYQGFRALGQTTTLSLTRNKDAK